MPKFYFNIYDGVTDIDKEGVSLSGWHEARLEAIRLAGSLLKDNPEITLGETWRMEVTDSVGLILFRLEFSVATIPAADVDQSAGRQGASAN